MTNRRALITTLLMASTGVAMLATTGCSRTCDQVKKDYEARVQAEQPFLADGAVSEGTHFGVAMHASLLNAILARALDDGLDSALDLSDSIKLVGGQSVSIKTDGKLLDLKVFTDKACDTCVRVSGKLDGELAAKFPLLGVQKAPLRGSATIVAPIDLVPSEDGTSTDVQLNLGKMAEIGKSSFDPEIAQMPPTWAKLLKSPLSKKLTEAVGNSLGSVTIAKIDALDLGIAGLKATPKKLKTDAEKGVFFLGFSSNLAGAADANIAPVTDVSALQNMAVTLHPSIVAPLVTAAIRSGKVSRQYIKSGKASDRGPFHVTVEGFDLADQDAKGKNPFNMNFRLWHMPENDDQCYWVDAAATGKMGIEATSVAVDVDNVALGESSLSGIVLAIAEWKNAEFLEESRRVLNTSLSKKSIEIPGASARVVRGALTGGKDGVTFRARVAVEDVKDE